MMDIISRKNSLQEAKPVQIQEGLRNLACDIVKTQVPEPIRHIATLLEQMFALKKQTITTETGSMIIKYLQ